MTADATGLSAVDHIVVLMLENRSFDHMLGYLYYDQGNISDAGHDFDGLTGDESNPGVDGGRVTVFPITRHTPNCYFMPGANPGEGFQAANAQLYGTATPAADELATMQGFVADYAHELAVLTEQGGSVVPGTTPRDIMGCFTPETLPVLSGLARGYAVCDRWFGSVPSQTMPNRAFALTGTSQGHLDNRTTFTARSIFHRLTEAGVSWAIYGYTVPPLTRHSFVDVANADKSHFGVFDDFKRAVETDALPGFVYLEPAWDAAGNSQHPNFDVARGEQFIYDVYRTLRGGPGWDRTLLVVTYDEHGGCYDHVVPPTNAKSPDDLAADFDFGFTRLGPRVPTVLVSPLIQPGTVFRAPPGRTPFDHTSVLRTVADRWGLIPLTRRDATACGIGAVLTLRTPRADDPLADVVVPVADGPVPHQSEPAHLHQLHAELLAKHLRPSDALPRLGSDEEVTEFIRQLHSRLSMDRLS